MYYKYSFILLLSSIAFSVHAQKATLPLDERGKYIYYEVVDSVNYSKQQLFEYAKNFLEKKSNKTIKISSITADSVINAEGKLLLGKNILIASRPSGEVTYNFVCELKDNKYRFWLTDFKFIPYMRDRYGNFVPSTPIGTNLEKSPGKLNEGVWKQNITSTAESAAAFATEFKANMKAQVVVKPSEVKKETISTKKW